MKKLRLFIIALAGLCTACSYKYDTGYMDFKPQVVLNSLIFPDSQIELSLKWSKKVGEGYDEYFSFDNVEEFDIRLYEDGELLLESAGYDGEFKTGVTPKAGSNYSVEVDVPYYGTVSAETSVPYGVYTTIEHTETRIDSTGTSYLEYNTFYHFNISDIYAPEVVRSIMVMAYCVYENRREVMYRQLYGSNPFCDQFNIGNDSEYSHLSGSSVSHYYFIRIPYQNVSQATPLTVALCQNAAEDYEYVVGYDELGGPIYNYYKEHQSNIILDVITPSDEFERYYVSAYEQLVNGDHEGSYGIFNTVSPVYCNIKNGVGIFAGYSKSTLNYVVSNE